METTIISRPSSVKMCRVEDSDCGLGAEALTGLGLTPKP